MAINTRDRRMSMVGFGLPVPRVLPNPDGAFATADRPQLLFLYAGLTLASSTGIAAIIYGPAASATIEGGAASGTSE